MQEEIKVAIDEFLAGHGMAPVETPAQYLACLMALNLAFPEAPSARGGPAPKRAQPERFVGLGKKR